MKCQACGSELPEGSSVCLFCGVQQSAASAAETEAEPTVEPAAEEMPAAEGEGEAAPAPEPEGEAEPVAAPAADASPLPEKPEEKLYPPVTMGNWLLTLVLLAVLPFCISFVGGVIGAVTMLPVITVLFGIVSVLSTYGLMFYWAFAKRVNPSKRNYFKATLLYSLVVAVLVTILVVVAAVVLAGLISSAGLTVEEILWELERLFM